MNYIVLNGKKSTAIKGLLIQQLPDFYKPLMRTQIEQIDGRDGDIVTKLGYSAYTKEISIGLYGNYDIDEVINYFNSEGKVVFSNELDKYYDYQIIDEIDFERLIRFRTAKVKFHVQPFKHSTIDTINTFNTEGINSIQIVNKGNIYSKPKLTIYGNGNITMMINSKQVLTITLIDYITIDAEDMNAYRGSELKNRYVRGNYDDVKLKQGKNTISWIGNIERIEIENFSRWI